MFGLVKIEVDNMFNVNSSNRRIAFIKSRGMCGDGHKLVILNADGVCPICANKTEIITKDNCDTKHCKWCECKIHTNKISDECDECFELRFRIETDINLASKMLFFLKRKKGYSWNE